MHTQQRLLSFLPVLLIGVLSFLLFAFLWESHTIESVCLERIRHETELQTRMSAMLAEHFLRTEPEEQLARFASTTLAPVCDRSTRITLMRNDGTVLVDSWEENQSMPSHRNRPEVADFLARTFPPDQPYPCLTLTRYSTTTRQKMLYCVTGFYAGEQRYLMRTAVPVGSIESVVTKVRREVTLLSFLAMTIAIGLGYLLFYWLTQPLTRLRAATKKIAEGTFETPLPTVRRGSLREIASSIAKMSDKLQNQFKLLSRENILHEAILDSLQEGVILTDDQGRVLHMNATAARLIGTNVDLALSRPLIALWRNTALENLLDKLNSTGNDEPGNPASTALEDNITHNHYEIHVFAKQVPGIANSRGCLLVLYDKTKEFRLENYRRDFIANLSHEIKTPLTVISGAAEALSLDSSLSDDLKELVQTLALHATRLHCLLEDVLSLAKLESFEMKNEFAREKLPLADTIEIALSLCTPLAEERNMTLAFTDKTDAREFLFSPLLMEQVVVNLVENAIKYSNKGDTINVELSEQPSGTVRFTVEDHGRGIPEEDRQRVFERFYRVDRSRARASGGTGLGLAIVKHIVQLHAGTVYIAPSDAGAVFVVELPQA
ncbi:MAG: ATP-binding protein [Planctomycetia bacterium]|nr:ATP-binding protein [Planctomycetia bacterium]